MTEYFDVVDSNDKVVGRATREECHRNPNLIHRTAGVLVFSSKGEMLLQKRSLGKDTSPGKWSISSWGHLDVGESYEHAARRELGEEIGISANEEELHFLFKKKLTAERETEIFSIYSITNNGPFRPDKEEVSEVKFLGTNQIKKELRQNPDAFAAGAVFVIKEFFKLPGSVESSKLR